MALPRVYRHNDSNNGSKHWFWIELFFSIYQLSFLSLQLLLWNIQLKQQATLAHRFYNLVSS